MNPRLLLAAPLAALLVGCSADGTNVETERTDPATAAGTAAETTDTSGESFPVTVQHRYGSATVDTRPERVVSVGFSDHDHLLALGVVPIAVREWYGDQPFATWPWAADELGDSEPVVLPASELDVEQIAALEPDLIVGMYSGMTQEEYGLLSRIAPTVTSSDEHPEFGTPWREVTLTYGSLLGEGERAADVIADVDAGIAEVVAANPEFDGAFGSVTFYSSGTLGAYTSADVRSRLLEELGFEVPSEIDEVAGEGAFFAPVSLESADLVDLDVLVWITATEDEVAEVRELPVRDTLVANEEGREVFLPFEVNGAMSFSSPLSIPFALEEIVPELEAAVDGDPDTPVPSAQE